MAKKTIKKQIKKSLTPVIKYDELPATQGMIKNLQKMIKSEVKSLEKKMDARFGQVDAQFSQIDARFSQIDARFSQIDARFSQFDSRFNQMDSKIEKVLSEVHRMAIMMEEQNSRNKFVLDGYEQLYKRQDRLETDVNSRLQDIETIVTANKKSSTNEI